MPDRNTINMLKDRFPNGCRVALDHMDDAQAPPPGTTGTVIHVDDMGTIHVAWDTGSSIGVVFGADACHKI